ncbi:GTP-binding protein [Vulcanisaeta thermophila]|uniref:GTP-binding protein n=1 Tax=Vulcanisaeta thermophila TaxID=867917 RepID=UPI000852E481|nr:ATP/GTP-binding protein [Vulcanisaeta thermophila]
MKILKIVIAGPYGAGKTTFVKTLSEVLPIETDVAITKAQPTGDDKRTTTVAFDYGRMKVRSDLVVHLFGVPGQERFSFMWKIIARGMHGYLFIVDGSSADRVRDAVNMYMFFRENFPDTPHVVAVNKQDLPNALDVNSVRLLLKVPYYIKVIPLIATSRKSALFALVELLEAIRNYMITQGSNQ